MGVRPRTATWAAVVANLGSAVAGEFESTGNRVPTEIVLEAHLLHFFERKCVSFVHAGNKFTVSLFMAFRRRQVKPHEGDKGVDVGDRHGGHVAEMRGGFVYGCNVRGEISSGIVLEGQAFFQPTREKFVRNGGASERVEGEDVRPGVCATGGRSAVVTSEHFKERAEMRGLVLHHLPEPLLQNVF